MTRHSSFLTALQLSDSFLPTGSHTASYGIEQYLNENCIETSEELQATIKGFLHGIIGPSEMVALGAAYGGAQTDDQEQILTADHRLHTATLPMEFRDSSTKTGQQLLSLCATDTLAGDSVAGKHMKQFVPITTPAVEDYTTAVKAENSPGHQSVATGVLCQQAGINREHACQLFGYTAVTDLLGAAQRLGRFSHTTIQAQLSDHMSDIEQLAAEYATAELSMLSSFAPMADIMGMKHEQAEQRLFMS